MLWSHVSNEVWPWSTPSCPSSLEERLPSQGSPSSQVRARSSVWRGSLLDKLQSSPDPLASFLSWVALPDTKEGNASFFIRKLRENPDCYRTMTTLIILIKINSASLFIKVFIEYVVSFEISASCYIQPWKRDMKAAHLHLSWVFWQRILYRLYQGSLKLMIFQV